MMGQKKARLPWEYQEVEYIEADNKQYINTKIIPTTNLGHKVTASIPRALLNNCIIFSQNEGWNWGQYGIQLSYNSQMVFLDNRGAIYGPPVYADTVYEISRFDNSHVIVNGTSYSVPVVAHPNIELLIFTKNYPGGRCHAAEFFDMTTMEAQRNYVPCYRKSDNKPGMYDLFGSICPLTNSPFYINAGTGDFLVGPEVN